MEKKKQQALEIIVVGGGKIGFYLARTLLEHGHHPALVERDRAVCKRLANALDVPVISGDGTSVDVLEQAGVAECDALIGVTGQDEENLVACQLAKKLFSVRKTIARVNNPKNADVMRRLGVDIVISATDSIARLLEHEVDTAGLRQLTAINQGEASICETRLPADYRLSGKRLSELDIPQRAVIISINRQGSTIIPRGDTQLLSGDTVIFMAKNEALHEVKVKLKLED